MDKGEWLARNRGEREYRNRERERSVKHTKEFCLVCYKFYEDGTIIGESAGISTSKPMLPIHEHSYDSDFDASTSQVLLIMYYFILYIILYYIILSSTDPILEHSCSRQSIYI